MHLYLQGLLSHLPGKNAEDIATFVEVERQVIQDFIGTVPWDHRPLVTVLVGQVAERLGEPDGIIAFDPSSFPKRGDAFGGRQAPVVRPPGQGRQLPGRRLHGLRLAPRPCLARLPLVPARGLGTGRARRQACHVPPEVRYQTRQEQCGRCSTVGGPGAARLGHRR